MEKTSANTKPRIYVACLAAYNNGRLYGEWIDADQDEGEVRAAISRMLALSPEPEAEEYAIHDYEGFAGVRIEEYADIGHVVRLAAFVSEHGALGGAVLSHFGGDVDEAEEAMANRYLGSFDSLASYMQDLTEETVTIPASLRHYIDYEAMARDAELGGDVFTIRLSYDAVHVFSGH